MKYDLDFVYGSQEGGNNGNFDEEIGMGQPGFDADSHRRGPVRNPAVPDCVDGDQIVDVAQVNGDQQQACLVAPSLFQKLFDAGQHLACLRGSVAVKRLRCFDKIDGILMSANI